MAEAVTSRKVQITVPVADVSVIEWLNLQYSASESVRRLIREAIEREGFVDVANRPVRPPARVHAQMAYVDPDEDDFVAEIVSRPIAPTPTKTPAPAAAPAPDPAAAPASTEADDDDFIAEINAGRAASAATPPPASRPQADAKAASATIDDLLGL
ncbi:hypothetical protein [Microbacterium stercoris]|uniref:Uncharacterized protein n=1 Tax=Microbacterium stercoris TaxID=2820289 RepID=A0A939QI35_9MICO|nr:hypothetical protein [Microbacterium stercoris]MBO3663084.1 hypothetical protein [Microbacterium stercoris]